MRHLVVTVRTGSCAAWASALLAACSPHSNVPPIASAASAPQFQIAASIQELMEGVVDPAADGVWDVVGTTVTPKGAEERRPRTNGEWQQAKLHALTLIEATNLLVMDGRRLVPSGGKILDEGSEGVLSTEEGQQRLETQRQLFLQFALALRAVSARMLEAIDSKNADAMLEVGADLDEVCESCHMTFWYPNQPVYRIAESVSSDAKTPLSKK